MPGPAISASNVRKTYGKGEQRATVLESVSVAVEPGQIVFLVGPSGSGKTTLLSILGCLLQPDQGTVQVLGSDVTRMNRAERAAFRGQHMGFVFQTFNLFPNLSAFDNIRLSLTLREVPLPRASLLAGDVLRSVGLAHRAHLRPGLLSTGECQRVAIARALASNPSLVFADEPTASLDAHNGLVVMNLLTDLVRQKGGTLMVVTHDYRIHHFADRILHLEDGRLDGAPVQTSKDTLAAGLLPYVSEREKLPP
jgi:putative ABC transport system ATP-binding protein